MISEYIKKAKTIFWDFDGVIKDSVSVKSDAFEELFLPFGSDVAKKLECIMRIMEACLDMISYQFT